MNDLTQEELDFIIYENSLWKNIDGVDTVIIQVVDKQLVSMDFGKAYASWKIVIYNTQDTKYYRAIVLEGEYITDQKIKWVEVFPKEKTIIVYE